MRIYYLIMSCLIFNLISCSPTKPIPQTFEVEDLDVSASPSAQLPQAAAIDVTRSETTPAAAIFAKRILPIFHSENPSSCTECHLSGVDLKQYILPTQEATFASLVSAGMIDTNTPDESKILRFIERSGDQPDLISQKVRTQEYDAFREWIRAAVREPVLLTNADRQQPIGSRLSPEVIRHTRKDRILASFVENVWTEIGRCEACHSPRQNNKQVSKFGDAVSWIKPDDPLATLAYLNEAGLIDTEKPEDSLLLKKPTLQVEHEGGQKSVVGDRTYKQFRRFLEDYAASVNGLYKSAEDLPEPDDELSVITDIWLKIEDVPAEFDQQLLQVDLYRFTDGKWTKARIATSDRTVFGENNLWQQTLSLTAGRDSPQAESLRSRKLPAGKYLAKMYVDQQGKLQSDYQSVMGEEEFVGEVEFESRWPAGYGKMTVIKFPMN